VAEEKKLTLPVLQREFDRLQSMKGDKNGGVEPRTLTNIAMMAGEQTAFVQGGSMYVPPGKKNVPSLIFNLIEDRVEKVIGRMLSVVPSFKATPDAPDPAKISQAKVVSKLDKALDEKLNEPSRARERMWWLLVGGTCFEYCPWRPNVTIEPMAVVDPETGETMYLFGGVQGQQDQPIPESMMVQMIEAGQAFPEQFEIMEQLDIQGDVGSEILGPLNVFIDISASSIRDLGPSQSVTIVTAREIEWVEENWPDHDIEEMEPSVKIQIVKTNLTHSGAALSGVNIRNLIPMVQGSPSDKDPNMVQLHERYAPRSVENPEGRYTVWIPDQGIVFDGPNPYEDGIPIVDFHFKPTTTSFFSSDHVTKLIPGQKFINKRLSQAAMYANAWVNNPVLLPVGLSEDDWPTDQPGFVEGGMSPTGNKLIARMEPAAIGGWFEKMLSQVLELVDDLSGGADIFARRNFPSSMRGPQALPIIQEIADTQWGPFLNHYGEQLAIVKQMRINRVKQFYPATRTLHYTGDRGKDDVLVFHTEEILRKGTEFNITIDRGSLMPEIRAMKEARMIERLNSPLQVLYMDRRTGQLDPSKMAAELSMPDEGREEKEAQSRTLQRQELEMMLDGQEIPVQPWNNHPAHLDELEGFMETKEWFSLSEQAQQLIIAHWQGHTDVLQQMAQQQQAAAQEEDMNSAIAQATQQTAAKVMSEALPAIMDQMRVAREQGMSVDQIIGMQQPEQQQGGAIPADSFLPQQ
jgi:hypothetical protein